MQDVPFWFRTRSARFRSRVAAGQCLLQHGERGPDASNGLLRLGVAGRGPAPLDDRRQCVLICLAQLRFLIRPGLAAGAAVRRGTVMPGAVLPVDTLAAAVP